MAKRQDWIGLAKQIRQMGDLASPAFIEKAIGRIAKHTYSKAQLSLLMRKNPYGRQWKKAKVGGLNSFTSQVSSSLDLMVKGSSFTLEIAEPWAKYHQRGAKRFPGKTVADREEFKAGIVAKDKAKLSELRKRHGKGWRLPARAMLPKRTLPPQWEKPLAEILQQTFKETYKP